MASKRKKAPDSNKKIRESQEVVYTTIEEWEADNFPRLVQKRLKEKISRDPEALGAKIAADVFEQVGVALFTRN